MQHHHYLRLRRTAIFAASAISSAAAVLPLPFSAAAPVAAQTIASEHEGAAALGLALRRLGTTKRVLMIGAHPDDENTAILSTLALGEGADVAYLSLTRGEGGQNLIGPELQEGLGIIRTEELLAARRLDGARQFFTRAYEFGYSRSAEETLSRWPRDTLLADVVAAIRSYRPNIVISVFSGTPRDGHGHHQVAGMMARESFEAAGDPTAFPDQVRRGLAPHAPAYLFQAVWRPEGNEPLTVSIGEYDPLLGRSTYQIAMASRSRHRSQDMGQPEPIGPRRASVAVLAGNYPAIGGGSFFSGLDTTLSAIAYSTISQRSFLPAHVEALRRYEAEVARAKLAFNPLAHGSVAPILSRAREELVRADSLLAGATGFDPLRREITAELEELDHALWTAAGLMFDAQADDPRVVPGREVTVTLTVWNGGTSAVGLAALEPTVPSGWQVTPMDALPAEPLEPAAVARRRFSVRLPDDAPVTEPYYLRDPRTGDLYSWPDDDALRALPFEPPVLRARAAVRLEGQSVHRLVEIGHVEIDKALGERRRPVLVVPAINIAVGPPFAVVPLAASASDNGGPSRSITVAVMSDAQGPITGTLRLDAPPGWQVEPASVPVRLESASQRREVRFTLRPPPTPARGKHTVRAVFESSDGRRYDRGYTVIEYPHTRPQPLYRDALTEVSVFPVAVADDMRVGYVEGAGDDGALALRQLGVDVTQLSAEALARADLARFHAIVLGIRAYEVRQDLIAHNERLLEYARKGGTVVVQYNKHEYVEGNFAPFPLSIARPHGRITDETAPVRLLDPAHPLLTTPNHIDASDFAGWVQERGLYFADSWDERYSPLLEIADPGEPALRGGLLVARVGEGWYIYTGLALFRQLPEGVPGAYRLLANLVSLGRQ